MSRYRVALFSVALTLNCVLAGTSASAAFDMVVGSRSVVQNKPVSDCSTKAKSALNSVLQNAFEAGAGTGQWLAYGPQDSSGHSSASAAIHCFPVGNGYVVTFTCAAEVPPNPDTASGLCTKLTTAFGAEQSALRSTQSQVAGGAEWR
jgi:hypothetical protein